MFNYFVYISHMCCLHVYIHICVYVHIYIFTQNYTFIHVIFIIYHIYILYSHILCVFIRYICWCLFVCLHFIYVCLVNIFIEICTKYTHVYKYMTRIFIDFVYFVMYYIIHCYVLCAYVYIEIYKQCVKHLMQDNKRYHREKRNTGVSSKHLSTNKERDHIRYYRRKDRGNSKIVVKFCEIRTKKDLFLLLNRTNIQE